jgi:diacylglycerol kinase (ATP)
LRLLLVFNPHAAFGRAAPLLPQIVAALEQFAEIDVWQTMGSGDAAKQVGAAPLAAYDGLVAAGGDGTLFEVLNGLYRHPPEQRVPLGLLPVGTGNAFARDLGLLPGDWEKGVALIGARQLRRVDVGRVECGPADAPEPPFHFLNIVGAGLPVDAMRAAERIKFVGSAAYSLAAFWRAMMLRSYPLAVELDGEYIEQDALFVEISNTRYTGTSFLMAPAARFDDGLFDVTVVRRLPRWRLLRLFPTIYRGKHVDHPEVLTRRARSIRILVPGGLDLAPDGEFRGHTPATITCLRGDLEIFAPS